MKIEEQLDPSWGRNAFECDEGILYVNWNREQYILIQEEEETE